MDPDPVFVGLLKINDDNSRIRIRIRIHWSEAWIRGSKPKCHGSGTLLHTISSHMLQCQSNNTVWYVKNQDLNFYIA
jgi:hypothetical protein